MLAFLSSSPVWLRSQASTRVRASVNAHTCAHTQNPNEFEVRFTPDATYIGYKLIMRDENFMILSQSIFGRDVTLTTSAYPESLTQTYFGIQHLSHKSSLSHDSSTELVKTLG